MLQKDAVIFSNIVEKEGGPHWIIFGTRENVVARNVSNKRQQCGNKVTMLLNELVELSKMDMIFGCDANIQGIMYAIGMDNVPTDQRNTTRPLLHNSEAAWK